LIAVEEMNLPRKHVEAPLLYVRFYVSLTSGIYYYFNI